MPAFSTVKAPLLSSVTAFPVEKDHLRLVELLYDASDVTSSPYWFNNLYLTVAFVLSTVLLEVLV